VTELLFSYGTLRLPTVQRADFGRLLDGSDDAFVAADAYEVDDYARDRTILASGREAWVYVAAGEA
jgi:hypothetical protein